MLKYLYYQVLTREIPNELSLGIYCHGCPHHCNNCHSPHLWSGTDDSRCTVLDVDELYRIITSQKYITNVLFMGGEWSSILSSGDIVEQLLKRLKNIDLKFSLYTGHLLEKARTLPLFSLLSFIKVGKYEEQYGGLDYPSTNQKLYRLKNGQVDKDITSLFWRTNVR